MKEKYHESAILEVEGKARYIEDIEIDSLKAYLYTSPYAKAKILFFDLTKARALEGVEAVLSYQDIEGNNQMGPIAQDEECLASKEVHFIGQAIFLIAATSRKIAKQAAQLIEVEFEELTPTLSLEEAIEKGDLLGVSRKIERGEVEKGFLSSDYIIEGKFYSGAQEHWYLETQISLAVPGEDQEMKVYSSTQHPSETQAIVAEVLGVQRNEVEVEIRRMGGAFGGKETQANHYAAFAALLAKKTRKPVLLRLEREEDQAYTGKRHPYKSYYKVGFSTEGLIKSLKVELNAEGGSSLDLSGAILERAMFHIDNAYYIPNIRVTGKAYKTNKPSNTAFRGFGGPQGILVMENIIDAISRKLSADSYALRKMNYYSEGRNITHYLQALEEIRLPILEKQLLLSSNYYARRKEINDFNKTHKYRKRGLAMSPVKFGISFTTSFLNQAGALVNIYQDGTILVNHGGTEMGQGLHTKMRRVAALEFGIAESKVKVNATNTSKVPNTSATAASSGTDLNGMAVKNAVLKLKKRLQQFFIEYFNLSESTIVLFGNNKVYVVANSEYELSFIDLIQKAYLGQVSLSATGFYKTPDIHYNKEKGRGKPFHYFAYGMSVSEVEINVLTGETKVLQVDVLHDAGKSLHQEIDQGQVEGAFVQGMGWLLNEELRYNEKGKLLADSPSTYKIPAFSDFPKVFNVNLLKDAPNPNTIKQSKAVGEPPFMLAISVWLAVKDAISAVGKHKVEPELNVPATAEAVLEALLKVIEAI